MHYKREEFTKSYKQIFEIALILGLHRDTISYRIIELGIIPINRWWYDEYQIELIKDFERSPRSKYIIVDSKMNKL